MKHTFVFYHGFGFTQDYWQQLLPYFSGHDCILLDAHYFANTKPCQSNNHILPENTVGIGHSLGFIKLCQNHANLKAYVGLNAFTHFLGYEDAIHKIRLREYRIFKRRLHKHCQQTLMDFYQQCGIATFSPQFDNTNFQALYDDFEVLQSHIALPRPNRTLILNTLDDEVVPHSITKDNFASSSATTKLLPKGAHALGYLQAKEVSEHIWNFIEDLI